MDEFIRLLQAHGATCVADMRTIPRSRHNPQFNKASLPRSLKQAELGYVHMPGLGGLRHAKHDSPNTVAVIGKYFLINGNCSRMHI